MSYGLVDIGNRYKAAPASLELRLGLVNAPPRPTRLGRTLTGKLSVILPRTGERVHRSALSFSLGHDGSDLGLPLPLRRTRLAWASLAHPQTRNVLKCLLAYLFASLGVYWARFDTVLGRTDSKHVVATVAVYFHPARSKGLMLQLLQFVLCALAFSFTVTFAVRAALGYLYNHGEDEVSHVIDLVLALALLGAVAFMKQRVNKQLFNTACLLASIAIVACIVKEGSSNAAEIPVERVLSTLRVVVAGCAILVLCCFALWPVSAVDQLRRHLNDSFDIMSALLLITTARFLKAENVALDGHGYAQLNQNIALLNALLEELRYELCLHGRADEWEVFAQLVLTTKALARHVQALRSSAEMQWELLHERDASAGSSSTTELFQLFVSILSPSIHSFLFTLKSILGDIPFENHAYNANGGRFVATRAFQTSLERAILLYKEKQAESFERLYNHSLFQTGSLAAKTNQEEVTACCGNFLSLLAEFARVLVVFLELTEQYERVRQRGRSWRLWRRRPQQPSPATATAGHTDQHSKFRLGSSTRPRSESTLNAALLNFQSQYQTASERTPLRGRKQSLTFGLWRRLKVLGRTDVQFGIRVGLGALFLSTFAFLPRTKDRFTEWRIEWALVVYCIMMNKSVGGTTMTVKWRFLGTFLGCCGAYLIWIATNGNVYCLCLGGWLLSLPSFYIILYWKQNNPFGRFILLAYNITALYLYSMLQKDTEDGREGGDDPPIAEIAFHRFVAVSIGIVFLLTMATCFLPNTARSRLKKGLTLLWLRMGVIWNSDPLDYSIDGLSRLVGLKDQKGLHDLLHECAALLKQAPVEFRLKGAFPQRQYAALLQLTSNIIDSFQNMNLMIEVDPKLLPNEEYVLKYISAERMEVEHRIFLIFYMIASALRLGFPLPGSPASTEHAKDRMLVKLHDIRSNKAMRKDLTLTNEDYVLLYSYILVTNKISLELNQMMLVVRDLLGEISEDIFELV